MTASTTDRIEKQVRLRAPRPRVWRAITDHREFEQWFGVRFDAPFTPGAAMRGRLVGTAVDADVAKQQRQFSAVPFEITIDRIEPERLFSFRWHPGAVDPAIDYSAEPTTLVEFTLDEVPEGTLLTLSESGFDRIPLARRAQAFTGNDHGWTIMTSLVDRYLGHGAATGR